MADKPDFGGSAEKDPPFPGEDPTQPELDMWLKVMSDRLKKTEFFYVVRGETPPSLIGISEPIDVSMLVEQPAVPGETAEARRSREAWNFRCRDKAREETQRAASYMAGIEKLKNGFAGRLADSLRDNAPGKLRQLKAVHEIGPDRHDGAAMWSALKELKNRAGPTQSRSADWHERQ